MAIGPGRLDQRTARVAVTALVIEPWWRCSPKVFPGTRPDNHERSSRGKAGEIAQFCDERHRMHELDAAHRLQRPTTGQAPARHLVSIAR